MRLRFFAPDQAQRTRIFTVEYGGEIALAVKAKPDRPQCIFSNHLFSSPCAEISQKRWLPRNMGSLAPTCACKDSMGGLGVAGAVLAMGALGLRTESRA